MGWKVIVQAMLQIGPVKNDRPSSPVLWTLTFPPHSVEVLREAGFLTADQPTTRDVGVAVGAMLAAAWKAGVRASGAAPRVQAPVELTPEELAKAKWAEKMGVVNDMNEMPPVQTLRDVLQDAPQP